MSKVETAFNLKDFLLNELAKLPHDRALQIKGHNAVIRCPFHSGGMERTPSMGILLEPRKGASPGVYSCFACKAKGSWSNFAELYNLTPLSKGKYKEAELSGGLLHLYQEDISPPDYRMMIPISCIRSKNQEQIILRGLQHLPILQLTYTISLFPLYFIF